MTVPDTALPCSGQTLQNDSSERHQSVQKYCILFLTSKVKTRFRQLAIIKSAVSLVITGETALSLCFDVLYGNAVLMKSFVLRYSF